MASKTHSTQIAGVTFGNRQNLIQLLEVGEKLLLIREPDNPHDPNAIMVEHSQYGQLGYIPRSLAVQVASELDCAGGIAEAVVIALTGGTSDYPHRGALISFTVRQNSDAELGTRLRPFGKIRLEQGKWSISRFASATITESDYSLVVAYCGKEPHFEIWQCCPVNLKQVIRIEGLDNCVTMAVSHAGDKIATCTMDNEGSGSVVRAVAIWDVQTGQLIVTIGELGNGGYRIRDDKCRIHFSRRDDFLVLGWLEGQATNHTRYYAVAGWRTDTWEQIIDSKKTLVPKESPHYGLLDREYTTYPLILDPDDRTVLFEIATASENNQDTLQWLDLRSMAVAKQMVLPTAAFPCPFKQVLTAGENLVAVERDTSTLIINTRTLGIVDSFSRPWSGSGGAHNVFAEFKLVLYYKFVGDEHGDCNVLHTYEYGAGSQSLVAHYLNGKPDWEVVGSSSDGKVFVVRENYWSGKNDYLAIFGHHNMAK